MRLQCNIRQSDNSNVQSILPKALSTNFQSLNLKKSELHISMLHCTMLFYSCVKQVSYVFFTESNWSMP